MYVQYRPKGTQHVQIKVVNPFPLRSDTDTVELPTCIRFIKLTLFTVEVEILGLIEEIRR